MTVRNIKKNLAGAEDLLHGIGVETQARGGSLYDMHKLDTYVPTYDVEEMKRSSLTFMRLYGTDTAYTDYRRNPTGTIGIPSDLGGVWEPIRSSELPVCGNFIHGAYVFSSDCLVGYNDSFMQWQGDTPKVVAAGATPATSGGIGAGAWIDRSDVTLRSDLNVVVKVFESVAEMVADPSLVVGQKCKTLGYYSAGDGGGSMWDVVLASSVVPNTFDVIQCTVKTELALVLRAQDTLLLSKIGAADGQDGTALLQFIASSDYTDVTFDSKPVLSADVTFTKDQVFRFTADGGLSVGSGFTAVFNGEIVAPSQTIFTGLGDVDLSQTSSKINVVWFDGEYLNDMFRKMKTPFTNLFKRRNIIIPKPRAGQKGARLLTPTDTEWWVWEVDSPITFDRKMNNSSIEIYGDISPTGVVPAGILIDSGIEGSKVDNIEFATAFKILGTNATDNYFINGIEDRGSARVTYKGMVDIQHTTNPIVIGGSAIRAPVTQMNMEDLHTAYQTGRAILSGTSSRSVVNNTFGNITIESHASVSTKNCMNLLGNVQLNNFRSVRYVTASGNASDNANDIVNLISTADGSPQYNSFESIVGVNINGYALNSVDASGGTAQRMEGNKVSIVKVVTGKALSINYQTKFSVENSVSTLNQIDIGPDSDRTSIRADWYGTINDSGSLTMINGLNRVARGVGSLPDVNGYKLGHRIWNTSDNTLWERIAMTGVAVNDFVQIA